MRHRLTSEIVIAALEDADDYQAFEASVITDYDADTAVERELALRLASVLWRVRRAMGIETAVIAELGARLFGNTRIAHNIVSLALGRRGAERRNKS